MKTNEPEFFETESIETDSIPFVDIGIETPPMTNQPDLTRLPELSQHMRNGIDAITKNVGAVIESGDIQKIQELFDLVEENWKKVNQQIPALDFYINGEQSSTYKMLNEWKEFHPDEATVSLGNIHLAQEELRQQFPNIEDAKIEKEYLQEQNSLLSFARNLLKNALLKQEQVVSDAGAYLQ